MSAAPINADHTFARLAAHRPGVGAKYRALEDIRVGAEVKLQVLDKIVDHRFLAAIDAARYVVESELPLQVGQTIKATVTALGEVVELKYLGAGRYMEPDSSTNSANPDEHPRQSLIDRLQVRYRVALSHEDAALVARASDASRDQNTMMKSGLYLRKLDATIDFESLQALYAAQVWEPRPASDAPLAANVAALLLGVQQGKSGAIADLAMVLEDSVEFDADFMANHTTTPTPQAVDVPSVQGLRDCTQNEVALDIAKHELGKRLLNTQDSSSVAYRYGTLPVLIADQLVELDVVVFRERARGSERSQGLRKLVMTLRTDHLGRIEIVAQSYENALSISIGTQSAVVTESLAAHAHEVRDLVTRLGWQVDSVAYRLVTEPSRAAAHVVRHVLSSESLDASI